MSRIESGKTQLHLGWEPVGEIMKDCVKMMQPMMQQKQIHFDYPKENVKLKNIEYEVDHQKMQQMIMNLLNNAYKFTAEGGHVSISARNVSVDTEKRIATDQIIVKDDGCGMSKEFLTRIFHPFEQERTANTESIQGTGLGLALARNIATRMGGDILVESELGEGSTFTIIYPYRLLQ